MKTLADEKRDSAVENMSKAIKDLAEMVVDRCSGYDDYNAMYKGLLEEVLQRSIRIREMLLD